MKKIRMKKRGEKKRGEKIMKKSSQKKFNKKNKKYKKLLTTMFEGLQSDVPLSGTHVAQESEPSDVAQVTCALAEPIAVRDSKMLNNFLWCK